MGFQCPNCGNTLEGSERFCRKCGSRILPEDLHEAATRSFDPAAAPPQPMAAPPPPGPTYQTGPVGGHVTGEPSYYVPPQYEAPVYQGGPGAVAPYPGAPMAKPARNWKKILLISFLSFILLCGIGTFFVGHWVSGVVSQLNPRTNDKGGITLGSGGKEVNISQPKSADDVPDELKQWLYPNAPMPQIIDTTDGDKHATVMTTQTTDDAKTVADYYKDPKRLPKNANVTTDGQSGTTAINFPGGSIVINAQHWPLKGAAIVVALGTDMGDEDADDDATDADTDSDDDDAPPAPPAGHQNIPKPPTPPTPPKLPPAPHAPKP